MELVEAVPSDEAACVALRALGLAHTGLGDLGAARAALRRSVGLGERMGYRLRTGQARTSLLVLLAEAGNIQAALAEATLAEAALASLPDGKLELARLQVNRGLVLQRTGRTAEALASYGAAERVLREHGDARCETVMLNNRGILQAYRGNHAETTRDLTRARRLAADNGFEALYHRTLHNLGFAALRAGDLPGALRYLDEARQVGERMGLAVESVVSDRADALLAAGLAEDARQYAEQAAEGHERKGFVLNAAEARLSAANAALAAGNAAMAAEYAHTARVAFTRQRRPGWAAAARSTEHAARFAAGERGARILRDLVRNAAQLEQAGWLVTPQESKLLAARTALAIGRAQEAAQLFTQVASARKTGPARLRVVGWEAEAALRESGGDIKGAGLAVDRGLRVAADYVATLGATDLRAGAALLGASLAETGLRLALTGGSARQVLVRAEQWRAATLRLRPVRPPNDGAFAQRLGQLRAVMMQINEEGLARKNSNVRGLQTTRLQLEREVKELAQQASGGEDVPQSRLDLNALSEQLGERALVEYVRVEDSLHAVSLVDGRARHHHLGSYQAVLSEYESLRFSLGKMALRYGSPAMQQATHVAFEYARNELDKALMQPMAKQIGDRPLVLVPTGSLHALAWPVLPSLTGRLLTVSPSARTWQTAAAGQADAEQGPLGGQVVLAHGPGLPDAEEEIGDLAKRYPLANPLTGADATAQTVADALDGAQLAHIAAHGRFRADNPLFSSLELADGPLTVYDLEGMHHAPTTLVLSACDTALSGIRPGDELMGLASAVFSLGTRTLIASIAKVHDGDTRALMNAFHAKLDEGLSPANALVSAQQAVPDAHGFVCFGAG